MVKALIDGYTGYCDDIDCCPGNSDSFCGGTIQTALQSKESRKPVRKAVQQPQAKIARIIRRAIYNIKTGSLYLAEMDLRKVCEQLSAMR
jgi:hypothetical protein